MNNCPGSVWRSTWHVVALSCAIVAATPSSPEVSAAPPPRDSLPLILRAAQNPAAGLDFEGLLPFQRRMLISLAHGTSDASAPSTPAVCFAPDTPREVMEAFYAAHGRADLDLYRLGNRWSATATNGSGLQQGDPTTITWSFIPDGTNIPGGSFGAGEPAAPSNLIAVLNGIYGNQATWQPLFQQVFDRFAELTGLTYVYQATDDGAAFPASGGVIAVRGDVRIGGHFIDGNSNILAYNFFPDTGDMVLDSADSFYSNTGSSSLRLRNVVSHEHGHGVGLNHVCPTNNTKLMEPFINLGFVGPQLDDTLGANRGYGDTFENNNTTGAATSLGPPLGNGVVTTVDLSVDDNADADFFRFDVTSSNKSATITLQPVGATYLEGPQNSNGSCTGGVPFNALAVNNLGVELRDTNGVTVLAFANDKPAGQSEMLAAIPLPSGTGPYFVRVFGGNVDNAQLYFLEIEITDTPAIPVLVAFGAALTAENCPPGNSEIDPSETVTVNFTLRNVGGASTTYLIASLQSTGGVASPSGAQNYGAIPTGGASATRPFSFTASGVCGGGLTATLALQDGATSLGTVSFSFTLGDMATTVTPFNNPSSISIPLLGTATPYPSDINVAALSDPVTKVTARLNNFSHTYPADLDILLVGPTGQKVMLMADAGGGNGINNVTLTFDDDAGAGLPTSQISTGTYTPTDYDLNENLPMPAPPRPYGTALAAYNAANPNGAWSLYVNDAFNGDSGSISAGWTLNLTTTAPVCCTGPRLELATAVSRKQHGASGPFFNVTLPGIESRSGGATNAYTIVYTFTTDLLSVAGATVTQGVGTVGTRGIGPAANQYTVELSGVTNIQRLELTLNGIEDTAGAALSSVAAQMGVLVGDATADSVVNSSDITLARRSSGQAAAAANFRQDFTTDGIINSADITTARRQSGAALPP